MHQNQVEGDGCDAHQTPGRTHPNHVQSGHVLGTPTGDRSRGHHQQHSDGGGGTTLRSIRARGDGLSEPPKLAPAFWSKEQGASADGSRLCQVDG